MISQALPALRYFSVFYAAGPDFSQDGVPKCSSESTSLACSTREKLGSEREGDMCEVPQQCMTELGLEPGLRSHLS